MLYLLLALIFIAINVFAFLAFEFDKRAAMNGEWRIKESTLLAIAFLGGSSGALIGQQVLRHKTRKQPFRTYLIAIAILHLALATMFIVSPDWTVNTLRGLMNPASQSIDPGP